MNHDDQNGSIDLEALIAAFATLIHNLQRKARADDELIRELEAANASLRARLDQEREPVEW